MPIPLSKFVTICPIGLVEDDILDHIAQNFERHYGFVCRMTQGMAEPKYAYDERRNQYDSKLILKHMIGHYPRDALRFMGVTHEDIFVPILKYVYGLAEMNGKCAVISIHRLLPEYYDMPSNRDLLMERVEKTAVHELGHTFGLTHCRDRRCIMYSSKHIGDTDYKGSDFCPACKELFNWRRTGSFTSSIDPSFHPQ